MKIEQNEAGSLGLRLSDDPTRFYILAELVRSLLKGIWKTQIDGLDQSYWDLDVDGVVLTVHREHYLGVSVCCEQNVANVALLEKLKRIFEVDSQSPDSQTG